MPKNITITIPNPVLTSGQHFKVRFKAHNLPNWTPLPNQTNTPFQIMNLSDGDYDIGYIVVLSDGSECPERIDHFNIFTASCPCITNAVGKVEELSANNFQIKITFTNPSSQPGCGWIVKYTDSASNVHQVTYPTLTSPLLIPISANDAFIVEIYADCCGKDQVQCAILDLGRAPVSSCIPAVFPAAENQKLISQIGGQYYMQITCSQQSNPITTTFYVQYQQLPGILPGIPDSAVVTVAPTGTAPFIYLTFPIHPNPSMSMNYDVNVSDICGQYQVIIKT